MRHVVMALDVIDADSLGDSRLLIEIEQVSLQVWVIDNALHVALEMTMINDVEPNQRAEQSPIGFDNAFVEQVTAFR